MENSDGKFERRLQIDLRRRIEKKEEDLRDKFAMAALVGLLSDPNYDAEKERVAFTAYTMADAMIAERNDRL